MKTNEKWIFVLNSDSLGEVRLQDTPDGWNEQKVSFSRNQKYLGLFRSYSTSLRFFGDGKDYLQKVFERNGTEHIINVGIYEYFGKPTDKYILFFRGVIDLSTYVNDENKFIEVDINDNSFTRKIISRDDIRIDLNGTESVDGESITEANEVTVNIHQRELLSTGNYELNESVTNVESSVETIDSQDYDGLAIPIQIFSQDEDVTNLSSQNSITLGAIGSTFWDELGQQSKAQLSGEISGTLKDNVFFNFEMQVTFKMWVYVDDSLAVIDYEHPLSNSTYTIPSNGEVDFSFTIDTVLNNLTAENTISFVVITNESSFKGFSAEFTKADFSVAMNLQWEDISSAQGYLMHEVGQQLTKVITGQDKFVSEFLGRPDIDYEEFGEGSLISFHAAQQIRKLPTANASISLTDWYKSSSAIWNTALGIEYDDVGQPFVRYEKLDHFFNGRVIGSLHQVSKLTKTVAREFIYNTLKVGYDKSDTEITNGLEEYNNKFTWADFIKSIKNEGDFVSKIRTDGYGIEKLRRLSFETNPTDDTREDNDNFVIVVKEDGTNYKSVKDEEYDTIENILSPETAYNLDLSPGRNLRRNGSKIRAGLEKYLDEEIKFKYAEQKQSMITKRSDESVTIKENDHILPSDLNAPLWLAEIYECEFVLSNELYRAIINNPGGIFKLSTGTEENTTNYNYGWILDIGYNAESKKSTGQFLRVNLNNPDLVLIDPEGNPPDTLPPEQPEPGEDYGFEGGFPFVFIGPEPIAETNAYSFSGIEEISIPDIPDFERTSTFYYKARVKNTTGTGFKVLWDNLTIDSKGIGIVMNAESVTFHGKTIVILIHADNIFDRIEVKTPTLFLPGEFHEIEIWYDGTSLASGITANVDSNPVSLTTIIDGLSSNILTGSNGCTIGKLKSLPQQASEFELDYLEMTYDSTPIFKTDCSKNGAVCVDLSGQDNDGIINLGTSTEDDFFITI